MTLACISGDIRAPQVRARHSYWKPNQSFKEMKNKKVNGCILDECSCLPLFVSVRLEEVCRDSWKVQAVSSLDCLDSSRPQCSGNQNRKNVLQHQTISQKINLTAQQAKHTRQKGSTSTSWKWLFYRSYWFFYTWNFNLPSRDDHIFS